METHALYRPQRSSRFYQYLATITANICIICSEIHYGWPSPSIPILTSGNYTFQVTSEEGSWLTVMPLISGPIGMIITFKLADIVGRKALVLSSSIPYIVGGLIIGLANTLLPMFVGRFLIGCGDGMAITVVPMYLGEIAEPKIRGLLASAYPVSIVFGILLINILGYFLQIDEVAFIATSVALLIPITFSWMPESPYFLIMRGKEQSARRSLQLLRGTMDVSEELNRIAKAVKEQNESTYTIGSLFAIKNIRKSMIISLGLRSIQQLSGVSAIIFYCKTIFEKEETVLSPDIAAILYFTVQLVVSTISSCTVDICGRKPLLLLSTAGTVLALMISGAYLYIKNETNIDVTGFNVVPLVALLLYNVLFSVGLQTVPLLIMSELFLTNIKSLAICINNMYFVVIVFFISKFFHWSTETYGLYVPFFTFAVCCVLGLIFIACYVVETKGKTLEDIQRELREER